MLNNFANGRVGVSVVTLNQNGRVHSGASTSTRDTMNTINGRPSLFKQVEHPHATEDVKDWTTLATEIAAEDTENEAPLGSH